MASFAGAVAAARLMKLTEAQTTQAIALTAVSMGGLCAAGNTSCAREYQAGQAAMAGINAAQAAAKGFVAEEAILEAKQGHKIKTGNHPRMVWPRVTALQLAAEFSCFESTAQLISPAL